MLMGAFFGVWGADKTDSWIGGLLIGIARRRRARARPRLLLDPPPRRPDRRRHGDQLPRARHHRVHLHRASTASKGTRRTSPGIPNVNLTSSGIPPTSALPQRLVRRPQPDDLGRLRSSCSSRYVFIFRTAIGLRIRSCGEHPRAADTVGINVYAIRYAPWSRPGCLAACGGAFLSVGFVSSFNENMTAGRGFIALAALIFGNWRPVGAFAAAVLFGFSSALAPRLENSRLGELQHPLRRPPVPADAGRGRRRDRPLDPAGSRWPPLQEAVASGGPATRTRRPPPSPVWPRSWPFRPGSCSRTTRRP